MYIASGSNANIAIGYSTMATNNGSSTNIAIGQSALLHSTGG